MVRPFLYEKKTSYLITRNVTGRHYYLRPSKELKNSILYCIADAQAQFPVLIHALCAMTNHIHIVITDTHGHAPRFVQAMNQNIARYVNCMLDRSGAMWEGGVRPNYCVLPKSIDIMDKVIYTLCNPVKAGIVPQHHLWPGAISTVAQIGRGSITTKRPKKFFTSTKDPKLLTRELVLSPVPGVSGILEPIDYFRLLAEQVATEEKRLAETYEAAKMPWMGCKQCMRLNPQDAPKTKWKRFSRKPTVSSRSNDARKDRILRLKRFRELYGNALKTFREGHRDVAFPEGTFFFRIYYAVPTQPFT